MEPSTISRPSVDNSNPLPNGTRVQEFVIERTVGVGGFGIVYQAQDTLLQRTVAIKEYLPSNMVGRTASVTVSLRSESHAQDFESGKLSFIDEARMLARFKHPALIEVYRFWEQNCTAYIATPFYEGSTLKQWLRNNPTVPSEIALKQMVLPILDALEHMHNEQVYHRDISPDNIMILQDGTPILLDLGAARQLDAETDHAFTVLVKPGYAPIEQYAGDASIRQGPWTDIYGWGATVYFALTGKAPPPSASRIMSDSIIRFTDLKPAGYSMAFLSAIDAALAVRSDDRPQNIAALRALFLVDPVAPVVAVSKPELRIDPAPNHSAQHPPTEAVLANKNVPLSRGKDKFNPALLGSVLAVCLGLIGALVWFAKTPLLDAQVTAPSEAIRTVPVVVAPTLIESKPETLTAELSKQEATAIDPSLTKVVDKPATARLLIKPWGEVWVNGENRGVSPPLKFLSLPAGDYKIEIRNAEYPPHKMDITLKSGETSTFNHTFIDTLQKP